MLLKQIYNPGDEHLFHYWMRILTGNTSAEKQIFSMTSHMIRMSLYIPVNGGENHNRNLGKKCHLHIRENQRLLLE